MPRTPPIVGTKGPVKQGGTGGGLSKESVKAAVAAKPAPAPKKAEPRNMRMEPKSRAAAMDKLDKSV